MVGHAKWISLTALSLILLWQHLPAQAQRFTVEDDTVPGQSAPVDETYVEEEQSDTDDSAPTGEEEEMEAEVETTEDSPAGNEDDATEDTIDSSTDDVAPSDTPADDKSSENEAIKERYPDGRIKVQREVTQDASGNYLNHGAWKMWDQRGNLMAQGQYHYGDRTGTWIRWYRSVSEAPLLRTAPYKDYAGPFVSQATFQNGKLNGYWTIYDGKLRKISQWRFVDGRRHGLSIWYHANGRKMREIEFREGDIDGHLLEWAVDGSATTKEAYQGGRKLGQKTTHHADGKSKKAEGMYLFAKDAEKTADDWWECKLVVTAKTGKDERHGPWTSWHTNGQRALEGTYEHDLQVGLFTWWHANGQKALEGRYDHGKQDGTWTWWYPNGQKSIHGEYAKGNPTGRWTWWGEDGRVAQSADLSHSEGVVIQTVPSPADQPERTPGVLPHVRRPATQRQPVRR
ncbi:MAG: toxin-antitoxin system YwqK family antitoxin [Pirellulales bacterium]